MQISLAEAELRPNESPAKNTASYCIVLRHIVKVLDRSTPVFHPSKSNLPSLPDDTIPATLAHISAALSSRPIFSPYSFYPLHRPYICPACLCCTSDALPPRLPSFRRPTSPRAASVSPRIPKRRLCQYPAPPARYALFDPHPRRRAIVNSHPIFIFLCALVYPCLSAPPRITPSSVHVLVPLPHRFSPPRRFCQHPLSLPQNFLHSPVSRLALGSIIPLTRRIALSSSDELRRAAALSPSGRPLSPLDARLSRTQVNSLPFLSLSCAFLPVPQCSQHPFFSFCSIIAYFLRRENT